jgi:hypothetical protein
MSQVNRPVQVEAAVALEVPMGNPIPTAAFRPNVSKPFEALFGTQSKHSSYFHDAEVYPAHLTFNVADPRFRGVV